MDSRLHVLSGQIIKKFWVGGSGWVGLMGLEALRPWGCSSSSTSSKWIHCHSELSYRGYIMLVHVISQLRELMTMIQVGK